MAHKQPPALVERQKDYETLYRAANKLVKKYGHTNVYKMLDGVAARILRERVTMRNAKERAESVSETTDVASLIPETKSTSGGPQDETKE